MHQIIFNGIHLLVRADRVRIEPEPAERTTTVVIQNADHVGIIRVETDEVSIISPAHRSYVPPPDDAEDFGFSAAGEDLAYEFNKRVA